MSTSLRTYRAIKQALVQAFRVRRQSHQECYVLTLALLICGIVGSRYVQFAKVVEHAPFRARKNESVIKRFTRRVQHDASRLLIATCLAYLWVIAVGVFAHQKRWVAQFHRTDRCDLSLFQVGLRAIPYALREGLRLPACFVPPSH
jgi:hypothetical protein